MCQGIEAIGLKLLTCIYDPKTQNPYASSCYAWLTFSLPGAGQLGCWIYVLCLTWTISQFSKCQKGSTILVQGTNSLLVSIQISCHTNILLKIFKEMVFPDPGIPFFPIPWEHGQPGHGIWFKIPENLMYDFFFLWRYIVMHVKSSRMPMSSLV